VNDAWRPEPDASCQQALLLLNERLHGPLGGLLSFEELAVEIGRLFLHLLHCDQALAGKLECQG
jgi:hypothetical protein